MALCEPPEHAGERRRAGTRARATAADNTVPTMSRKPANVHVQPACHSADRGLYP